MREPLEVYADASLKQFGYRTFTCSGVLCTNTHQEKYVITQDSTNNRGELLAVYMAIRLAADTRNMFPGRFGAINIYSDSQFAIFGLKKWMSTWLSNRDSAGVMHGSTGAPVKNQEMFLMIVTFCVVNKLIVHFFHQKGHVNVNSPRDLAAANRQFKQSNGMLLTPENIFKISFYNDIVDKNSRAALESINPNDYPVITYNKYNKVMCQYVVPRDYRTYIK